MSSPMLHRPDSMPLREALRGLRFILRRGGETLADTVEIDGLPKPAADLAGAVLREMTGIARNIDEIASGLAKSVLGGDKARSLTLHDLEAGPAAEAEFGAAVYAALRSVLHRLGAPGVFVSEAAARRAYASNKAKDAATLTVNLLDARVVRGATAQDVSRVPASALEAVAIFAVLLWLQSTRSDDENEDALDAATDLAVALAVEVDKACVDRDVIRIAELYRQYVGHV